MKKHYTYTKAFIERAVRKHGVKCTLYVTRSGIESRRRWITKRGICKYARGWTRAEDSDPVQSCFMDYPAKQGEPISLENTLKWMHGYCQMNSLHIVRLEVGGRALVERKKK